ncbi:hypothetical protein SERLA73DRAFT_111690 [Serpula lacrymans var. lacrymans S7.3]|uniref:GST N-terminal domain-containing protein n=2 Tax=Serpula lacrymans var. lacrymans TaxID=341189 RepID=F8Q460_SERL3|nr:uncharacterized protein SERLADRAFT_416952 [Serpula lacrymans var. lacrymans S7.9]EGN96916.1 hypothetical protein SERLA73DRAFT_111690 [Serpula lacrymans var. lacrymans S7.3]EGO22509.1 hypothetical protein SERLADRAFT_416952 [Serpula lacrymans var. lacrymans S7.9]
MSQPIILYDIPRTGPVKALSGNMFKVRYTLAYKGLAFKSVWVESQDIEERMKAIGAKPTGLKPDGSDFYTLPVIQDPSTGAIVSDSFTIAEYLEETYPSTPTIFPHGSQALISTFDSTFMQGIRPMFPLVLTAVHARILPTNVPYFRQSTEMRVGMTLEEISPEGPKREQHWKNAKDFLGVIDGWYSKSDGERIMGDTFSYADIIVGGWIRCFSGLFEGEKWEEISTWHGGRWGRLLEEVNKYPILA